MNYPRLQRAVRLVAVLAALTFTCSTRAQFVLGANVAGDQSGATPSAATPLTRITSPSLMGGQGPLVQWGSVEVRPHANYSYAHATGLRSATGEKRDTDVNTTTVGVLLNLGTHWFADYTHGWTRYSAKDFRKSQSDYLLASGNVALSKWSAGFTEQYSSSDTTLVETGRQTGQEVSDTTGVLEWHPRPDFSASLTGNQNLRFIKTLPDVHTWSVRPAANYLLGPNLTIGVGVTRGYVLMYGSADANLVQPSAQATWQVTRKTALQAEAGWEQWKFYSSARGDISGSFYAFQANYAVLEHTQLNVGVRRGLSAAPFRGQVSRNEVWSASLKQRLLTHFQLQLGATNQKNEYLAAPLAFAPARSDRYRSYSASLGTTFLRRGTISGFYRWGKNTSDVPGFAFTSEQVGFEVGIHY